MLKKPYWLAPLRGSGPNTLPERRGVGHRHLAGSRHADHGHLRNKKELLEEKKKWRSFQYVVAWPNLLKRWCYILRFINQPAWLARFPDAIKNNFVYQTFWTTKVVLSYPVEGSPEYEEVCRGRWNHSQCHETFPAVCHRLCGSRCLAKETQTPAEPKETATWLAACKLYISIYDSPLCEEFHPFEPTLLIKLVNPIFWALCFLSQC